jgi:ADP-heptose:LPS heptosyltransferase
MAEDAGPILAGAGVAAPYVVLLPGSSARHPHKRWPHYADLAAHLAAAGRRAVVVPGPEEVEECRAIPAALLMEGGRVLDFFKLAGVLKGAAFAVGNDSGPTHLAAHLGVPGLGLFGRSHLPARMTGIERPGFRVMEVERLAELPLAPVLEAVLEAVPAAGTPTAGAPGLSAGASPAAR